MSTDPGSDEWLIQQVHRLSADHALNIPRHADGTQQCACGTRCASHSQHVAEVQVRFVLQYLDARRG